MKFAGNEPMNKRLTFGGYPDRRLYTGIVFRPRPIGRYEKWLTDIHSYWFARRRHW